MPLFRKGEMNSITKIARFSNLSVGRRNLKTTAIALSNAPSTSPYKAAIQNFDPNNYHIPVRPTTMDDLMEPYGSWKTAYEAERKSANLHLLKGVLCLATTMIIFFTSGITEGLLMPNLDNIMEETEPFNFDKEGRVSV